MDWNKLEEDVASEREKDRAVALRAMKRDEVFALYASLVGKKSNDQAYNEAINAHHEFDEYFDRDHPKET